MTLCAFLLSSTQCCNRTGGKCGHMKSRVPAFRNPGLSFPAGSSGNILALRALGSPLGLLTTRRPGRTVSVRAPNLAKSERRRLIVLGQEFLRRGHLVTISQGKIVGRIYFN